MIHELKKALRRKRKDTLLLVVPGGVVGWGGIGHHSGPRGEAPGELAGREMGRAGAGSVYCGFPGKGHVRQGEQAEGRPV